MEGSRLTIPVLSTPAATYPDTHVRRGIQVLDPEVVERIAAGEVIERPVSIVRELVDNALDAGAGTIRIDVRSGGLRSIRVTDDGGGIEADQVDLAIRHHATSKLRTVDDLTQIATLGFRGEALPSIASVCELSFLTATDRAATGIQLEVRFGEVTGKHICSRTHGSTVTARNLFANLPARLKFIGSARAESALIVQLIRRYALAHPHVQFHLSLDSHTSLRTSGHGMQETIGEILGIGVSQAVIPLGPIQIGPVELSGFVTGRHVTRSSRQHITVLVNGRCVQNRALQSAFEEAYRPLLPRARHPIALLSLTVPRSSVDVNIHPSKTDVKIRDDGAIATGMKEAVREIYGRSLSLPSNELNFAFNPTQIELPQMIAERGPEWEVAVGSRLRDARIGGQVQGSLIIIEDETGMYLVDQHRAHERAIYELLCRQHAEGRAGQYLLEPLHIELSRHQIARLEPRLSELALLGFACEWFGGRSFLVRSVPVIPETSDLVAVVEDLLDLATDSESDWQHRLLTSIACRAATRRGKILTSAQAREIIDLLADTRSPAACPHGSPIILHFSDRFLERQFGW